jgi:hypothetical protein
MHGTIINKSITFFPTEAAALKIAEANGGAAEGYTIEEAKAKAGKLVVKVVDEEGVFVFFL